MKPININALIKKYGTKYVAKDAKSGKVVAHASRLDILLNETKDRLNTVISWVPKRGARYVFRISV